MQNKKIKEADALKPPDSFLFSVGVTTHADAIKCWFVYRMCTHICVYTEKNKNKKETELTRRG